MKSNGTTNKQPNPYPTGQRVYTDRRVLSQSGQSVQYSEIPGDEVTAFLDRVCNAGGAAILGRTSDGGAYSLTVIVGDTRFREWPKNSDEWLRVASILADELS